MRSVRQEAAELVFLAESLVVKLLGFIRQVESEHYVPVKDAQPSRVQLMEPDVPLVQSLFMPLNAARFLASSVLRTW